MCIRDSINRKNLNLIGSELISVIDIENGISPSDQVKVEINNICNLVPSNISILFGAPNQVNDNLFNSAYYVQNNQLQSIY